QFFCEQFDDENGIEAINSFSQICYRALSEYRLHLDSSGDVGVKLSIKDNAIFADFGAGAVNLISLLPTGFTGDLAAVKAQLGEIVGLSEIKDYILSLEENFKVQAMRKAQGLKIGALSMHMIFTGNPGTGKTTIARLVSQYLKAIGVLTGGQLVEVSRADLVGKYVGHTAPLTSNVVKSALGGVLFIDEAYSLFRGKDDSFGLEAIDTLVKAMEDNRDNLVVILAGYSDEMKQFLTANSGLRSRFPNIIEFPDYSAAELVSIAKITCKSKGYKLDGECEIPLLAYFDTVQKADAKKAGNGRLVRNKIEAAILAQSRRVVKEKEPVLDLLTLEDFDLEENL
ncbi:MAG: AAA family ATPase, partial [Oscillospiraceae bacterium]